MAAPKKALYFNENLAAKEFDVLREIGNGTVDLGVGETLVVGRCPIVKAPQVGCAILGTEIPKPKPEIPVKQTTVTTE